MKITDITFGQAIRFLTVSGQDGGRIYGANLIRALESRYGFWESPRTVADYDMTKGVTFLHGFFDKRFVIDRFQVFTNGIVAEAKLPTEEIDNFLDDILQWACDEVGITVNNSQNRRSYSSNIEVLAEMPFVKAFSSFHAVGERVTNIIRSYGINTNMFEFSGMKLNADNEALPTPKPAAFSFERREGKPFDSGFFFSTAPLKTADHLVILNDLEAVIGEKITAS